MEGGTFMARPVGVWVSIFPLDGTGKCSPGAQNLLSYKR